MTFVVVHDALARFRRGCNFLPSQTATVACISMGLWVSTGVM